MKILFDQGVPVPLRRSLVAHTVETAFERRWSDLSNGDLLATAERAGFDVLVTTDKNLKYQQNLSARTIAIVVLPTTSWPRIRSAIDAVVPAIDSVLPGSYTEVML